MNRSGFLLRFVFLLVLSAWPAPARAQDPLCDVALFDQMVERGRLQGQRETKVVENLIYKPDSILEYTCFHNFMSEPVSPPSAPASGPAAWTAPYMASGVPLAGNCEYLSYLRDYASHAAEPSQQAAFAWVMAFGLAKSRPFAYFMAGDDHISDQDYWRLVNSNNPIGYPLPDPALVAQVKQNLDAQSAAAQGVTNDQGKQVCAAESGWPAAGQMAWLSPYNWSWRGDESRYMEYMAYYTAAPQSADPAWQDAYAWNLAYAVLNDHALEPGWDAFAQKSFYETQAAGNSFYQLPDATILAEAALALNGAAAALAQQQAEAQAILDQVASGSPPPPPGGGAVPAGDTLRDAGVSYVFSNFGHTYMGGRLPADLPGNAPPGGDYVCDVMSLIWALAKCENFAPEEPEDGFFDLLAFSSAAEIRRYPALCVAPYASSIGAVPAIPAAILYTSAAVPPADCGQPVPTGQVITMPVDQYDPPGRPVTYREKICPNMSCTYVPTALDTGNCVP